MTKCPITSLYLRSTLGYLGFPITSRSLRLLNCVSCTLSLIRFSLLSLIISNLVLLFNLSMVIEIKIKTSKNTSTLMRSSLREPLFDDRFLSDVHKLIEAPFSNSARMDCCDGTTEMMDPLINLWVEERHKRL